VKTERFPETRCRACGYTLNALAHVGGIEGVTAGDVSVCIACGNVAIFTDDLALRAPTAAEWRDIMANPLVAHIVATVKATMS
jgi:predicted nucleic-acid-binding Zn-ribbon protein